MKYLQHRSYHPLLGIIQLTRYKDYIAFVAVLTLFGWFFSQAPLTVSAIGTLAYIFTANIAAVGFTFMINDIEDAEDDAQNPDKSTRNPVSARRLSQRLAYISTICAALVSYLLFSRLNLISFLMGSATILTGILYSWRVVRLKSIPLFDLCSHSLMLAGFQFLAAYFMFVPEFSWDKSWILPLLLVVLISMYGELFNELRDLSYDKKAGVHHSAAVLGMVKTRMLMNTLLVMSCILVLTMFVFGVIPELFILLVICNGIYFLRKPLAGLQKQSSIHTTANFQIPVTSALFASLVCWGVFTMILPYIRHYLP